MNHKRLSTLIIAVCSLLGCDSKKESEIDGTRWQSASPILSAIEYIHFEDGVLHYWIGQQPLSCYYYSEYTYSENGRMKGGICRPNIEVDGLICDDYYEVKNDTLYIRIADVDKVMRATDFDDDLLEICIGVENRK